MGFLDRRFGGGDSRTVRCSSCGTAMLIISNAFVRQEIMMHSRGCFQCGACGRYTCYGCSDNRELCQCGMLQWEQRTYIRPVGNEQVG